MAGSNDISRDGPPSPGDHHTPPVPRTPAPSRSIDHSSFDTKDATERIDVAQASEISLDAALEQLRLGEKPPMGMFSQIGAAFQHATDQDESVHLGVDDWRSQLEHAEKLSQEGERDIKTLRLIRIMLDHLWSRNHEDGLVNIANLLADGSRERE